MIKQQQIRDFRSINHQILFQIIKTTESFRKKSNSGQLFYRWIHWLQKLCPNN